MSDTIEPLLLDLVAWVAKEPRDYFETMDAWRTSCPRLPVGGSERPRFRHPHTGWQGRGNRSGDRVRTRVPGARRVNVTILDAGRYGGPNG